MRWRKLRRWVISKSGRGRAREEVRTDSSAQGPKARMEFYHDIAKARLDAQSIYINQIDSKTTSFFTIGSAVLPIVAGFLSSGDDPIGECLVAELALFVGFGSYLGLAVFYVWSLWFGNWAQSPDMKQWKEIGSTTSIERLQKSLGDSYVEAYRFNEPSIERKANKSAAALWFLFFEVVGLGIAVLAPLWPPW